MNLISQLDNRLSYASNNILLITDIKITRRAREKVYDICKTISNKVISTNNGVRIKYDDGTYCYIYVLPNLWNIYQNLVGLAFNSYYLIDNIEDIEKIILDNYKKKL